MDRASEHAIWFVVGALAGAVGAALWQRLDASSLVVVAGQDAEAATGPGKNPKLAAAGRRGIAASGMNSDRYRCGGCEMVTTAGPLTAHQRATRHEGRFNA